MGACFEHDMAYTNFKDLPRRTASDKTLRDKAFKIAKNLKHESYIKEVLLHCFMNFLIKSLQVVLLKVRLCQTNILWTSYATNS